MYDDSALSERVKTIEDSGYLTTHPTISTDTDTTSATTATHGGTITMVDGVTRDSKGIRQ